MARVGPEDKPEWRRVPAALRAEVGARLGAEVTRAERAYGSYGPSATFRLRLADGRRAFFKGVYPVGEQSVVRWSLDREERVYERLGALIAPWAPRYHGAVRHEGWHALLLEDLGPGTAPPWTPRLAETAMRAYGAFHQSTYGRPLPRWLPRRDAWAGRFSNVWERLLAMPGGVAQLAALAGEREGEARAWLERHVPALDAAALGLARVRPPYALLHLDTRSDNVRVQPGADPELRLFDWPFACVGPPEFDFAAFAQSVSGEGGPAPEQLTRWYAAAQPVREAALRSSVAAVAGFFARNAWQPAPEELPRLRAVQRMQLRATLPWAARLLDLPEPGWIEAIPV
jgi:Ser/Thr protein kinase RdoA (MazF antagonist)